MEKGFVLTYLLELLPNKSLDIASKEESYILIQLLKNGKVIIVMVQLTHS